MKVSLIVRAFNEERHIGRLLDGVEKQKLRNDLGVQTILVDSGSQDSTVSIARHMGAEIVHITKEDFTFGRALNLGCEKANGEILLFASAHVYPVYLDWIERMVVPFKNEKVALVYGRQIGNDVTKFSEHQIFRKWFPEQSNANQTTPFCNNANTAIRKSLWLKQPFDESLTGLEDLDWANKILNQKYHLLYDAEAVVVHVHEETYGKIRNRYRREAIALKSIMPHVNFSFFDFSRLLANHIFTDSIQAVKEGVFKNEFFDIVKFRFNQMYGTYLGHNHVGAISKELKDRFYYPKSIHHKAYINRVNREQDLIVYEE